MTHNSDTQLVLPPSAATSNRFSPSHSMHSTAIGLPCYPLQAHINNYPPPQVVYTTLAPSFENVAAGSFLPVCTQHQTGAQLNLVCTFSSSIHSDNLLIISRTAEADSGRRSQRCSVDGHIPRRELGRWCICSNFRR